MLGVEKPNPNKTYWIFICIVSTDEALEKLMSPSYIFFSWQSYQKPFHLITMKMAFIISDFSNET